MTIQCSASGSWYRGLAKKLHTLFMLGNLGMLRKRPQLCGA
ncbi:hypothetical protein [Comamonas terrigena]|nr:hypothetical protein [Comamonas terrigena]SUY92361.1 Uncharacterised protein [Comamonas terrigena]